MCMYDFSVSADVIFITKKNCLYLSGMIEEFFLHVLCRIYIIHPVGEI